MSAPLTVLIPCRDERMNVRPCIESVPGLADEVLVADSGSVDDTREIARSLGARVVEGEWTGYAEFKNWAIPQAAYEWAHPGRGQKNRSGRGPGTPGDGRRGISLS